MKAASMIDIDKRSEDALVATAKRGDAQAFEELVLCHRHRVLAVAQRVLNNREDAEDVAQETFHKAFLHLDSFQGKSRFSTWLTRIVINEAFMLLRRRRGVFEVLRESPDNRAESRTEAFVDRSPDPEESCWRRERTELLTKAINQLAPKTRRTILLRDIEERSSQETARILCTSIAAVKARVFHGRRRLRGALNTRFLRELYTAGQAEAQRC